MYGAKIFHRYSGVQETGKAAFDLSRSYFVRTNGLNQSEDSGVSSKKKGKNPFGLMRQVSCTMIIITGLVGPKTYPNWSKLIGHQVNILELGMSVFSKVEAE